MSGYYMEQDRKYLKSLSKLIFYSTHTQEKSHYPTNFINEVSFHLIPFGLTTSRPNLLFYLPFVIS